jgi:hypothetical protein
MSPSLSRTHSLGNKSSFGAGLFNRCKALNSIKALQSSEWSRTTCAYANLLQSKGPSLSTKCACSFALSRSLPNGLDNLDVGFI